MEEHGDDRVLLITGASSGIGSATARAAAAAGWRLVLAARSLERLEAMTAELGGPRRAVAVGCDVTDWADQQATVARGLAHFGRLDAAWANAGLGAEWSFFGDTPERWQTMVLTNVLGTALTIRAAVPVLRACRGHLLLTGSNAGRTPLPGSLYSATKHAVHAMAESLRLELAGSGVRVTVIAPGTIATPFFDTTPMRHPLDAPLQADDVARAVLYALHQPPYVDVNEILVRPTEQRH